MPFSIPAGAICSVRKMTGQQWSPHCTTKPLTFVRYERRESDFLVFGRDGWELRVSVNYVNDGRGHDYRPATRGRGASRRSARRTLKAWKGRG